LTPQNLLIGRAASTRRRPAKFPVVAGQGLPAVRRLLSGLRDVGLGAAMACDQSVTCGLATIECAHLIRQGTKLLRPSRRNWMRVAGMQRFLQQKTFRLWYVLALTVGAAIAIVAGISSQAAKFPAIAMFADER
jgi:hypothetical protein